MEEEEATELINTECLSDSGTDKFMACLSVTHQGLKCLPHRAPFALLRVSAFRTPCPLATNVTQR